MYRKKKGGGLFLAVHNTPLISPLPASFERLLRFCETLEKYLVMNINSKIPLMHLRLVGSKTRRGSRNW